MGWQSGSGPVPAVIDIADEYFIVADSAAVARRLGDPRVWREWWPGLRLAVTRDRGAKGVKWAVTGDVDGTAEIWVEPWHDGAIVHWFLRGRASRSSGPVGRREARRDARLQRSYVAAYKRRMHTLKDEFERDRAVGEPRPTPGG